MSAQYQSELPPDETTEGISVPQEVPLFTIVRGTYDEEDGGKKIVTWQESGQGETIPEPVDELTRSRQEARLEGIRAGRRHELGLVRNRFERRFTTWIPFSQAEMTLAVTGLTTKANKVLSQIGPNTLSITEQYYKNAEGFRNQAAINHANLMDAKVLDQDTKPSTDRIRQIPEIKASLADYIQARQFLERLRWDQKRGERKSSGQMPREREYEEVIERIGRKSDEELIAVWERAVQCAYSRRDYWQRELDNTEASNELVRAIKSEDIDRRA